MSASVIFQGVKFFWRTRNTVDVTLVEHDSLNTTEIVVYDPSIDKEAPRMYLNSLVLYSKLNQTDIQAQLAFGQRNGVLITEEIIAHRAKFDFLIGRLLLSEYQADTKVITAALQLGSLDGNMDDLCCSKPDELTPFPTPHHHTALATAGAADKATNSLNEELNSLKHTTDTADALNHCAEELTVWERWRIPIVFVKVAKNRCLSASDSRIWHKVTSKMKVKQNPARILAVLADSHVPGTVDSTPPTPSAHRVTSPISRKDSVGSKKPQPKVTATGRRFSEFQRQKSDPVHAAAHSPLSAKNSSKKPKKGSSKKTRKFSKASTVAVGDYSQSAQSSATGTDLLGAHGDDGSDGEDGTMADPIAGATAGVQLDAAETSALQSMLTAVGNLAVSMRSSFGFGSYSTSSRTSDRQSEKNSRAIVLAPLPSSELSFKGTDCDASEAPSTNTNEVGTLATSANCANYEDENEEHEVVVVTTDTAAPMRAATPRNRVVRLLSSLRMSFAGSSDSQHSRKGDSSAPSPMHQQGPFPLVQMVLSSFGTSSKHPARDNL